MRDRPRPQGALRAGKIAVAVLSVLVVTGAGVAWSQVRNLQDGLTTADVIDPGAASSAGPAEEQNILLVGLDTRTDAQGVPLPQAILDQLHAGSGSDGGDNTDTMIAIHIPAGGGGATAFSIPRDSYVQLAGGYGKHKINSAYTYAQVAAASKLRAQGVSGPQLNVQAAQAGAKNAIQTVQQFTGLTFSHFASVNLVGFYDISQAIGGVPVCLNAAVHDSYSGANFPAGPQTISGAQALAFVRQRHGLPGGDLDRIKRQQVFMASLAKSVLSGGTLTSPAKLGSLIDAVKKTVTLDQNWDVLGFAQQMQSMSSGKIAFQTIPVLNVALRTPGDGEAVQVDPSQVQAAIKAAISAAGDSGTPAGTAPAPAATPSAPPAAAPTTGDENVTVDIRNASGTKALGDQVRQSLTAQGYGTGTVSDVASRRTSTLDYPSGDLAVARRVAEALGGDIPLAADSSLAAGHLRVYLGGDYSATDLDTGTAQSTAPPAPAPAAITAGGQTCVN
ncbi:MAG: LytR family transcriptional regulator [Amycolatopsis sp.]|uniref:LCP family protein n=1 Tax=Amycolatopsis sp. TaxID=37632 RepID=UPI00261EF41A|nr:LCP family protein [Amycolatopsis sp.]MCU1687536.1 LytR family transcriptional regulator [Amycolatopsis sp.]